MSLLGIKIDKHNPFSWVHSGFGFVATLIIGTLAYVTLKDRASHLSAYFEFLIALNTLFWFKQHFKRKLETDKEVEIAKIGNDACGDKK